MKILESAARITLVVFLVFVWSLMFGIGKALAHGDKEKPPAPPFTEPKPTKETIIIVQPVASGDNHKEALWAGAAFGGLAVTALQKSEHPVLYSIGAGVALSLLANVASDSMNSKETRYAIGGAILGATGIGFTFGRNYFGWQKAIRW